MAISKKRSKKVENPITQRAIDRIYDDINDVIYAEALLRNGQNRCLIQKIQRKNLNKQIFNILIY